MSKKFEFLAIGDCTHDTFVQIEEASIHCNKDTNKCQICFSWADKIPATKITQVPGVGNAANVAVAAARMGFNTAYYTHVGDDAIGKGAIEVFKKEKIALDFVVTDKKLPSNHHVAINYGEERTIMVYHQPYKYSIPRGIKTNWMYFSSLGPVHAKLHKQIPALIKRTGAKMAFQPGTYQLREGKKKLTSILKASEIITLNREEAQIVTGSKSQDFKKLLKALRALGPKIVVITNGSAGAYAFDGGETWFVEIFPVPAKERTGAGDSFSSGFVSAIIKDKSLAEALLWGNANSTSVTQFVGAQKGLLTQAEIKKMIKKYKRIKPVRI
jgi:ribokinase